MSTLWLIIKEHIKYKGQILKLAKSDLIKTYRGALMGWMWALIKPAITIFVYWFAFSIGLRGGKPIAGFPFFYWLIAGMAPWFYMSDMITLGAGAIKRYDYLVTKMKFPVSTIPTFVSLSKLFVNICLMALIVIIFVFSGYPIDIYYLQLPLYILLMYGFFTTWSLFSAPLSVMSRDFLNLVKSLTTAIFWLSGILWDANKIEIPWLHKLLYFNPVTFFADGFRNVFIYKKWFFEEPKFLIGFFCTWAVLFVMALFVFKKLRKEIPDVL